MPTVMTVRDFEQLFRNGGSARVDVDIAPGFAPGDAIVTRNIHPVTHTRLPQYLRGRRGTIQRDHGVFVFPDSNAELLGPQPQHVYSVMFTARELWGDRAHERDKLYIDLFEDYMRHVET